MAKRIIIDPITRIEGHLRVDVEVDGGVVTKAWSSAQMFRGIEDILKGRDPRDAWVFTQRFCGVCTTVHALASVRAVEDALNVEVPVNAQYMRNIMICAHTLQDHIVHFYHLSALDWVDIVSVLQADPAKAAAIAQSISKWGGNTPAAFAAAKDRLAAFVNTGKLGIFGSGYWGHSAMKLPPEINLIAFTHYLLALDYQRKASQAVAILGGKDPHQQTLIVGGIANAINVDNAATFNLERIAFLEKLFTELNDFVTNVYLPDLLAIGGMYKDWFNYGAGVTNYIAVPEFPLDSTNSTFMETGGVIFNNDISTFREIKDWKDADLRAKITENTDYAWYSEDSSLHPWEGKSTAKYVEPSAEFKEGEKYTWCKAPRYGNESFQVGPLASVLCQYVKGDPHTKQLVDYALNAAGITIDKLHSTLGRHVARCIHTITHAERGLENIQLLKENLAKGDQTYVNTVTQIPNGTFRGAGFHEAPRGVLSHWIVINDGKIQNYQAVVPSTWNAGPKDRAGNPSPYEASLVGNPVANPEQPLEVIRTVHSFDPCIACAVHTIDPDGNEITSITVD